MDNEKLSLPVVGVVVSSFVAMSEKSLRGGSIGAGGSKATFSSRVVRCEGKYAFALQLYGLVMCSLVHC